MLRSLVAKRPLADAHRTTSLFRGRVVGVLVCMGQGVVKVKGFPIQVVKSQPNQKNRQK